MKNQINKKILFIYYQNIKANGIAKALANLTSELVDNGYEIDILFLMAPHKDFYTINPKVKKHYINTFNNPYVRFGKYLLEKFKSIPKIFSVYSYLYDIGSYLVLKKWLRENHQNYDTIVSCWYKISSMLSSDNEINKKTIAWEHISNKTGGFVYYNLLRKNYKKLRAVISLTQVSLDSYKKINPNSFNITNIIGNDYENTQLNLETKENIILTASRLDPEKNIREFIKIIKGCNVHDDWKVIIASDGLQKDFLKNKAEHLGLSNIEFLGSTSPDKMQELYRKSKIFCMTSLNEGLPTVLIEAMFCGNALISYDCPTGPSEIINPNNGFLIKLHDKESYISKINQLIDNQNQLSKLMISSKLESQKWEKQKIVDQWKKIL